MDEKITNELQSATFNRLIEHLRERKDVQNIDLMNLAGFCRHCLSKNGTAKKLKKKELRFQILMLENMFTVCLILNGKRNTKSNYFSFNLGNNSTKLHGLCLIFS